MAQKRRVYLEVQAHRKNKNWIIRQKLLNEERQRIISVIDVYVQHQNWQKAWFSFVFFGKLLTQVFEYFKVQRLKQLEYKFYLYQSQKARDIQVQWMYFVKRFYGGSKENLYFTQIKKTIELKARIEFFHCERKAQNIVFSVLKSRLPTARMRYILQQRITKSKIIQRRVRINQQINRTIKKNLLSNWSDFHGKLDDLVMELEKLKQDNLSKQNKLICWYATSVSKTTYENQLIRWLKERKREYLNNVLTFYELKDAPPHIQNSNELQKNNVNFNYNEVKKQPKKKKSKKKNKKINKKSSPVPDEDQHKFIITRETTIEDLKIIFEPNQKDFLMITEWGCEIQKMVKRKRRNAISEQTRFQIEIPKLQEPEVIEEVIVELTESQILEKKKQEKKRKQEELERNFSQLDAL